MSLSFTSFSSSVRRWTCGEQLMVVLVVKTEEVKLKHSSLSLDTNAEYFPGNERLGVGRLLSSLVGEEQLEREPVEESRLLWSKFIATSLILVILSSLLLEWPFVRWFESDSLLFALLNTVPLLGFEVFTSTTSSLSLECWLFSGIALPWFPFSITDPFSFRVAVFSKSFPSRVVACSASSCKAVLTPPLLKTTFVAFGSCCCCCCVCCASCFCCCWFFIWGLFSSVLMLL